MRDTVMLVELSESIVKELDEMLAFAMRYIRGEVINEKVSKLEIDRKRRMTISLHDRITGCLLDGASRERYMAEAGLALRPFLESILSSMDRLCQTHGNRSKARAQDKRKRHRSDGGSDAYNKA